MESDSAGVKQRFIAINKFVKDFYINNCNMVPDDIMKKSKYYNLDLEGIIPTFDMVSNLYGIGKI